MKRLKRSMVWMLVLFPLLGMGGWAEEQEVQPVERGIRTEDFLPKSPVLPKPLAYPAISDLGEAIRRSDSKSVAAILGRIEAYYVLNGKQRIPALAQALWIAASKAYQLHDIPIAEQCWQLAFKLDPTNPWFHLSMARNRFLMGPRAWPLALKEAAQAQSLLKKGGGGLYLLTYSTMDFLINWGLLLLAAMGVVSIFRGLNLMPHDFMEHLGPFSRPLAQALTFVVLAIPMLFVGLIWALIWFLFVFLPYMTQRFRTLACTLVIVLFISYGLEYYSYAKYEQYSSLPNHWILDYVHQNGGPGLMHELYRRLQEDPSDEWATLAYASFFTRSRAFSKAIAVYTRALKKGLKSPSVWNNLGNIFFLQELPRQAILFYEKAREAEPRDLKLRAFIDYNEGKAFHSILNFQKGEELIKEAFTAYPNLTRLVSEETEALAYYPTEKNAYPRSGGAPIVQSLGMIIRDVRFRLLLIFFAVATLLKRIKFPGYEATQCERCGEAYCKKCQATGFKWPYCSPCIHLFVIRDGVSPMARQGKLDQIQRFEQRRRFMATFVQLLLPGGRAMLTGQTTRGFFFLTLWAFAVNLILGLQFTGPWWLSVQSFPLFTVVGSLILGGLYGVNSLWVIIRR